MATGEAIDQPRPIVIQDTVRLPGDGPFVHVTADRSRIANLFGEIAGVLGKSVPYHTAWFERSVDFKFGQREEEMSFIEQFKQGPPNNLCVAMLRRDRDRFSVIIDAQAIAQSMPQIYKGYERLDRDEQIALFRGTLERSLTQGALLPLLHADEYIKGREATAAFILSLAGYQAVNLFAGIAGVYKTSPEIAMVASALPVYTLLKGFLGSRTFDKLTTEARANIKKLDGVKVGNALSYAIESR